MTGSEPISLSPLSRVRGEIRVPGDKSMSHRSLLFGAVATGTSRIRGLSTGGDVRSTRAALETLGVAIRDEGADVVVEGRGWTGLDRGEDESPVTLDCGNAGTTARLLCGLLAGRRGRFRLVGDESLSVRPMGRVRIPLERMGARFEGEETLPITIVGSPLRGGEIRTKVASAQVKSALILAALQADGESRISEDRLTRDHTERMLQAMRAPLRPVEGRGRTWRISGGAAPLAPLDFTVPGDPSSAAYAVALGCLLEGSEVVVNGVSLNPSRLGFYTLLRRMGGKIHWETETETPEPLGRIRAAAGPLQGIQVGPEDVVEAIDEIPLLAVVAGAADGETVITGAGELRKKESDRILATVTLLKAFGADVEELPDGMRIRGGASYRPAPVDSRGDHRIGMCAAVAAALADGPSTLSGHQWIAISYPGFFSDLERLASP